MFTGIIETTGRVVKNEKKTDGGVTLSIDATFQHEPVRLGESIANNGVCLTVTSFEPHYVFDLAPETLACTNLGNLKPGDRINLERALRVGDRMSGHWVQGHVDGTAQLKRVTPLAGGTYEMEFLLLDASLNKYCVMKGSITLNGVSLTIHRCDALSVHQKTSQPSSLIFQIIPHTWSETNLSDLALGDQVNVEVELIAKYIERMKFT